MKIRVLGENQEVRRASAHVGVEQRQCRTAKVMVNDVLETVAVFADLLTVSVEPTQVLGFGISPSSTTVFTGSTTATPTGGLGPYTYAWTLVSSSGGVTPVATQPNFATTAFAKPSVPAFSVFSAVFRCTVTDSFGSTATADVSATFENLGNISL